MSLDITGLEFLDDCTNEQLLALVDFFKNESSSWLAGSDAYRKNPNNPKAYVHHIRQEIIEFGSDTVGNIVGSNRTYKEILLDVCGKMGASGYTKSDSIEKIEDRLLARYFANRWDKMSDNDKKALLQQLPNEAKKIAEKNENVSFTTLLLFPNILTMSMKYFDLIGPNYKVIVQCVVWIAALRRIHQNS